MLLHPSSYFGYAENDELLAAVEQAIALALPSRAKGALGSVAMMLSPRTQTEEIETTIETAAASMRKALGKSGRDSRHLGSVGGCLLSICLPYETA